jgi:hypothetical protein
MIGQSHDDVEILLPIGILESLQRSTDALERLLGDANADGPALDWQSSITFRGIGAVEEVLLHGAHLVLGVGR